MSVNSAVLANFKEESGGLNISSDFLKAVLSQPMEMGLYQRPNNLKGVVLDFCSLFPGDFQGEAFVNEAVSSL